MDLPCAVEASDVVWFCRNVHFKDRTEKVITSSCTSEQFYEMFLNKKVIVCQYVPDGVSIIARHVVSLQVTLSILFLRFFNLNKQSRTELKQLTNCKCDSCTASGHLKQVNGAKPTTSCSDKSSQLRAGFIPNTRAKTVSQ